MPRIKKIKDENSEENKLTEETPKKRSRSKSSAEKENVDKKSINSATAEKLNESDSSDEEKKTLKKRVYRRKTTVKTKDEEIPEKDVKTAEPNEISSTEEKSEIKSNNEFQNNLLQDTADSSSDSVTEGVSASEPIKEKHTKPKYGFNDLSSLLKNDLLKVASEFHLSLNERIRKDDLIIEILRAQAESMGYKFGGGTLECLPDGYGFLRPNGLLPSPHDIYVSTSQIRRFGLRNGDVVWGIIRPPRGDQEHYGALLRVETVNFSNPELARRRPFFETLTPIFPDKQLVLETEKTTISTRMIDLFAPIGKGQRALVVAPPKVGKTTLIKNIANAITLNNPEAILMVLLIDERPEEVTDMERSVQGEVIASTFDRPAEEHMRVASLALEKAKRLVEVSKDVVLLLDSITRLARASNLVVPPSGRTLSGGMDPSALYFPKKFFGAARNIENGGSLTIIGTSLVETGSRMDDVIYEEFKGTGNMEIHLSRKLSEMRIFPAIDIVKSGTRKEELLLDKDDMYRIWSLRRRISNMDEIDVINSIIAKLKKTENNQEFLKTIKV